MDVSMENIRNTSFVEGLMLGRFNLKQEDAENMLKAYADEQGIPVGELAASMRDQFEAFVQSDANVGQLDPLILMKSFMEARGYHMPLRPDHERTEFSQRFPIEL